MSDNTTQSASGSSSEANVQVATPPATTPKSQHEWTVHAINIHGLFFERWCQKVVAETPGWKVRSTNYPVEYPPPFIPLHSHESSLDIRAERKSSQEHLTLVIECKKNNPDFINWIFFPRNNLSVAQSEIAIARLVNTISDTNQPLNWTVSSGLMLSTTDMSVCNDARETRGDYLSYKKDKSNFTKTSNAAIQYAAYQAALACQAIHVEELHHSSTLGTAAKSDTFNPGLPWISQTIVPVICTTAELYVCWFDTADVDPNIGEIQYDKVTLEKVDSLVY